MVPFLVTLTDLNVSCDLLASAEFLVTHRTTGQYRRGEDRTGQYRRGQQDRTEQYKTGQERT